MLAAIPITGQPRPSSHKKCFNAISHESLSSARADATQASRILDSRFHPVSRSESSPVLSAEQERKCGG